MKNQKLLIQTTDTETDKFKIKSADQRKGAGEDVNFFQRNTLLTTPTFGYMTRNQTFATDDVNSIAAFI